MCRQLRGSTRLDDILIFDMAAQATTSALQRWTLGNFQCAANFKAQHSPPREHRLHKPAVVSRAKVLWEMGPEYAETSGAQEGRAVFYIGCSVGLTLLAGLMSGLTLGLMSMDEVDLQASHCVCRTAYSPTDCVSEGQSGCQLQGSLARWRQAVTMIDL